MSASGCVISVVIPAYRAAGTIARAVDSVLAQTRGPDEIVVVDDGSPDGEALREALRPYGTRVRLVRKANGGAAAARNLGISMAAGDVIAFLDADDYWEPDKLRRQCEVLDRHPEVGLVACRTLNAYPDGKMVRTPGADDRSVDRVLRAAGEQAFELATRISTITVLVRRAALGENRFDETLDSAEDRDLWVRVLTSTPAYVLSAPLATAVLGEGSLSRSSTEKDCTNMLRVVHRHRELLGRRGVRKWEVFVYRRWAGECLAFGRPADAVAPAARRLAREPLGGEAWWVMGKALVLAAAGTWRTPRRRGEEAGVAVSKVAECS